MKMASRFSCVLFRCSSLRLDVRSLGRTVRCWVGGGRVCSASVALCRVGGSWGWVRGNLCYGWGDYWSAEAKSCSSAKKDLEINKIHNTNKRTGSSHHYELTRQICSKLLYHRLVKNSYVILNCVLCFLSTPSPILVFYLPLS